jgi:hypothetical protein
MITCLQADHLPAIHCSSAKTRSAGSRTLTEVVCLALYGSPLKPGSDHGSLREALQPLILEGWALWKDPNGPGWLRPHLELIANAKTWPLNPDTDDEGERSTLDMFRAAERWLSRARRMGFVYGLPAVLAEKVLSIANMSEADAIRAALAEADRIEHAEAVINAKAAEFYKLLSDAVATEQITLKGIATDPGTNAWLPRTRGEPPHQTIPTDYFELPMVHNLFDNYLEADRFSTEAKMLDSIFNRIERENEGLLIKWSDVKIPPEHVGWLLSTFRDDGKVTGDRPLSTTTKPQQATTWNTNWLSLPGALMWVVTRDNRLARIVDEQTDNDCRITLGISIHLAQEQAQTGESRRLFVEIADAWPALRRLIADDKIVAEGRSLERRGISAAVETRYPNDRIPSGDAANLIIDGYVPGIEPRDALAPDEMYRFANWQGRYWYDVRLRAADVLREFSRECETQNQPDPARSGEATSPSLTTMRPAFQKIRAAIQAEEEATGKPFPVLRAVERNKRLADRMVAQGLEKQEIPNERTFREYFNQGPGKPAKSG